MARGPRRQAREVALQVLYSIDIAHDLAPDSASRAYEAILGQFSLPQKARQRARCLAEGVIDRFDEIDRTISKASTRWKLHRLAAVDRNILRVATYELLFEPETPVAVVIDEAVEIARRFAGEESPGFVNGVLDAIARSRVREGG